MKQALAAHKAACQRAAVNKPRTVINLEETIGKQVGRRQPPTDPLRVADSTIQRAIDYQRAFPCVMPRRGVYRFHTHEEADLWMKTPNLKP